MAWKGAGMRALRWALWLLLAWVFVRGIVSLVPAPPPAAAQPAEATAREKREPDGLRAFPALFARHYLTWQPGNPDERADRLRPYLASRLDRHAGWSGKEGTGQTVLETFVYAAKEVSETRWLVTVAARTSPYQDVTEPDRSGALVKVRKPLAESTVYLAVPVARSAQGGWVVYDYPSLVAQPSGGPFDEPLYYGTEITDHDDRAKALLTDFFKAYLAGGHVTYLLVPGAQVQTVKQPWTFQSITRLTLLGGTETWALAEVAALDPVTGSRFTFRYTTELVERDGRWYVRQILQRGE